MDDDVAVVNLGKAQRLGCRLFSGAAAETALAEQFKLGEQVKAPGRKGKTAADRGRGKRYLRMIRVGINGVKIKYALMGEAAKGRLGKQFTQGVAPFFRAAADDNRLVVAKPLVDLLDKRGEHTLLAVSPRNLLPQQGMRVHDKAVISRISGDEITDLVALKPTDQFIEQCFGNEQLRRWQGRLTRLGE